MIKLTESQMYNMSLIIYNYKNNIEATEDKYNNKVIWNLRSKNLIEFGAFNNVEPTELGIQEYTNNIGKKVFVKQSDKNIRIEIYKKLKDDKYEFVYFFSKLTGGGYISTEELLKDYILFK